MPESELDREQHLLELATRGTHQLFKAGVEAGHQALRLRWDARSVPVLSR